MTERASASWDAPGTAAVTVLVSTYGRSGYLAELVDALERQDVGADVFEVVVVDNGSTDDTWPVLSTLVERTPLRLLALRLDENRGPGGGRNHAASRARAPVVAITDDDCLPTPGWVREVRDAFRDPAVDVLQGRVEPPADAYAQARPWDHTIWVTRPSPFFETCNVAYRRSAFVAAGGFDEDDPLFRPRTGRAFGEDAVLACRVLEAGGRSVFVPEALVHHRVVPATFADRVKDVRHAEGFPGLARRSPLVARWLRGRLFLSGASAAFDLALAGAAAAAVTRRPWPLVAAAPYLRMRWRGALARTHGDRTRALLVVAQHAAVDATILRSLVAGSVRHRRPVL